MKIALHLHDYSNNIPSFRNTDFRNPQLGNPGICGTRYEFIMLSYALARFSDAEVNLYCHEDSNIYPDGVKVHVVSGNPDLIRQVKADGNDVVILRAQPTPAFYDLYERAAEAGIKVVAWSHNYMPYDLISYLGRTEAIRRIVMVGREHYDYYLDHPAIMKSTYIHNMYDGRHCRLRELPQEPAVVYTGGLYADKSFHVLAAMWKDILHEVPDAKFYVIGSGRLYNKYAELGPYRLADAKYEAVFMKYLTESGEILPSVKFMGNLGTDKVEVYYRTSVGIANFGMETFCLSMLEMEGCGLPVVNMAHGGVQDVIKHGTTGYLGRNTDEIKKYIILLLKDRDLNIRLGRQAKEFAEKAFLPEVLVKRWLKLFDDVINGRPCEYIPPSEHRTELKRLKIANRWLRLHHVPTVPVSSLSLPNIKHFIRKLLPGPYDMLKRLVKG
ncbi:MAG: glycosyltransferase [Synergistaceae bacterium]|nr:glycosyltransferase [Synergistaceae bacterium]